MTFREGAANRRAYIVFDHLVSASAMAKRLIPLLDRILVQKLEAPTKSVGGVLLPDNASKVGKQSSCDLQQYIASFQCCHRAD